MWKPIVIIGIVVAFMISGEYFYYNAEKNRIKHERIKDLETITKLKIGELTRWHEERFSEAKFFPGEKIFIENTKQLLSNSNISNVKEYFYETLSPIKENHKYENIFITDTNGVILYSLDTTSTLLKLDSVLSITIHEAAIKRSLFYTDFYKCKVHNKIHYDIVSPIINKSGNTIAVMILRIDPEDYLYPFIQSWPVPSKTSETSIFRVEGDHVLFLNELRHRNNTALNLELPLSATRVVVIQAIINREGIIEGKDYRNVDVLGNVHKVPGTAWYLVAKTDMVEVYSELNDIFILLLFIGILAILLIGTGVALIYKFRQGNLFKEMLLKDKNLADAQEEFRTTIYSIGDGVITTDIKGRIIRMNLIAEQLTGWKEKDASGKKLEKVFYIINEETKKPIENPVQKVLHEGIVIGLANHTVLISKSGKEIPIADNGAPIKNEAGETIGVVLVFRDQTAERKAEEKLRESELKFSSVFHFSPAGIVISSISDGRLVEVNDTFLKMSGYERKEVIGLKVIDLGMWVYPEVRNQFLNLINKENQIATIETEFRKKSGEVRIGKARGRVVDVEGGKYLLTVMEDITERKANEKILRESEEKNKALVNAIPDLIFLINKEGFFVDYRVSEQEKLYASPKQFLGKQIYDVLPSEIALITQTYLNKLFETHELQVYEYQLASEGTIKSYECRLSMSGEDKALAIVRDITIRRRAEKNIRRLTRGVEQSPATIVITDINGNIEYVNPKFTEVTGYTFDEVKGLNPRILKSGKMPRKGYEEMWTTILNKKEWRGEFQNRKKDGELYWELASISPILDEQGEIINFIAVKENITEQKRLMNELIEAKQKAEEMNRIKTYFYANMSHELRTPFVGIVGFAELLAETLEKPEEKEMAEEILKASKRLTDTLNKILNVTNIEFGKLEVHISGVDVYEKIESLRILYSKAAEQQNTNIKTEFKCERFLLRTDEKLLEEILSNLINNAVKFTFDGIIKIIVEKIEETDRDYLMIMVADTGVGIPEDKQEIVWKEFRQVSEGYGRTSEGTGLGLSIVKKYTELLNGKINLKSGVGKGSIFTLELPLIVDLEEAKETEPEIKDKEILPLEKPAGQFKILVVEDDSIAIDFIKKILSDRYQIDFAKNAESAFKMVQENAYAALLVDINLGEGMNGLELAQKIRKVPDYRSMPIIAVTAYASNRDRSEFLANGFSHYISKPFALKDLKKLLQDALN